MPKKVDEKETLESLIAEVNTVLYEIKNEQTKLAKNMEKHHRITMKKLEKLREFDEIADMTNTVFEKRLCDIEGALAKVLTK